MPVPYVRKIKVENKEYFDKCGINPASLSLSQRNHLDKLITILKVCSDNPTYSFLCERTVLDFMKRTNGLSWDQVTTLFSSIENQIEADLLNRIRDGTKEYVFILHPRLLKHLREIRNR